MYFNAAIFLVDNYSNCLSSCVSFGEKKKQKQNKTKQKTKTKTNKKNMHNRRPLFGSTSIEI